MPGNFSHSRLADVCHPERSRRIPNLCTMPAELCEADLYLDRYHVIYSGIDQRRAGMPQTAKLFRNGRSQAVRLPADFRFPGSEVYVRRDPASGDVILSRRPDSWQDFFALADRLGIPDDFLSKRGDLPAQKRKLF